MMEAELAALVLALCLVQICQHWFAKRVVRQAESTADDAYPTLVAFPPEHPSAADPPGTSASPHRNTTAPMMPGRSIPHISCIQWHTFMAHEDRRAEWLENPADSPGTSASPHRNTTAGSRHAQKQLRDKGTTDRSKASRPTTAAGLARQAKIDENVRMPKHVRFAQPPSHHSPVASPAAASILPRFAKPSLTVLPIDDRRPSSSFAMRKTAVREPSNVRGAYVRDDKTIREGLLSRRAHVSGPSLESSSSLEEGQSALANRNEPPPGPRGMPSLPARSRQERRQPEDHGAIQACDAAGSSLLTASLHRYYASIEASPQAASAYVTDNMEQARPSPSSVRSWREIGQLPQRRTYRDIQGDKLRSSIELSQQTC